MTGIDETSRSDQITVNGVHGHVLHKIIANVKCIA